MENYTVYMEDVTIDTVTETVAIVSFLVGIISISLMVFLFFLICFGKRYKKHLFYRLVQLDFVTNILCHINTWFAIRIEMHPDLVFILKFIEYTVPGLLKWLKYLCYWFFHVHFWTAELLTLHRMASILFPYRYNKISNCCCIVIFIVIVIVSHIPKLIWTGFLYEIYIVDGKLIAIVYPNTVKTAIDVVAVFSIIYIALIITTGAVNYVLLSRNTYVDVTSKASIKRTLRNTSTVYSLVYMGEVVWSVLNAANSHFHFFSPWLTEHNTTFLLIVSDIFTLSLPYILIFLDKNVKDDVWSCFKKCSTLIQGTPAVVSRSSFI